MANQLQQFLQNINPFGKRDEVDVKKNLANYISPVTLQRLRQDVMSWRECLTDVENAWYPQRVKMQQLFIDTKLNAHVSACLERRKDLTMLRKFELIGDDNAIGIFCDVSDNKGEQCLTPKKWLTDFISYSLDALFFGYSLISLGDVENDEFKKITTIKRWNVSPDRRVVSSFQYAISGKSWDDEDVADWHIFVDTPNDTGATNCGYGLFYNVALYEIFLRNLLGFNGDFLEMYAQPYRVGKTMKTEESERAELENALRSMGSAGYAIIDPTDQIEFLETALGGTGYKGYADLEMRCEKKISKLILGHSDAIDSIPGKLGNNGEKSPAHSAMEDKQSKDGVFVENIINKMLIPRMVKLGFNINTETKFRFKNDSESEEIRAREDLNNKVTADIFKIIKDAGGDPDWNYFSDRTGITTTKTAAPVPVVKPNFSEGIKNKLNDLYK
jgi:phage gp29-like protein